MIEKWIMQPTIKIVKWLITHQHRLFLRHEAGVIQQDVHPLLTTHLVQFYLLTATAQSLISIIFLLHSYKPVFMIKRHKYSVGKLG